ncbi:MAG: ion channel [Candidatus Peribacteraceae bacterium]|nr:ion channel [Candidatus Peribacteraceae bacterium]MDD5742924.1 ion channel [Candidatus Peribacteraceae bacterium]
MSSQSHNTHPAPHNRLVEKITTLPYTTLSSLWLAMVALFAMAYALLAVFAPKHAPLGLQGLHGLRLIGNSFYYSIITSTTTGYGDIVPVGFSKILSSVQCVAGYFVLAVFVTKLVSQRQELAVRQMHKLTYEDVFRNIREGLFVIRKDFDRLIEKARSRVPFTPDDCETLATAYKQGQSLLLDIPEFYDPEHAGLYMIDHRREQLLYEAVHRTLLRINQLMDAWTESNGQPQEDAERNLIMLLQVAETIISVWRGMARFIPETAFDELLMLQQNAQNRTQPALCT